MQPRHFHAGPNPASQPHEAEQPAEATSAPHLYQHALQSVFAFLRLAELAHVSVARREWRHVVRVMPSTGRSLCDVRLSKLLYACAGELGRHVGELHLTRFADPDPSIYGRPGERA